VSNPDQRQEERKRAHQGLLKTLRPSKEALELATLRGHQYDWPVLRRAAGQFKHYVDHREINRAVAAELKKHKKLFGPKREEKRRELRAAALAEKGREHNNRRTQAWDLHNLTNLYIRHRERIQSLPEKQRPAAAKELVAAYCSRDTSIMQRLEGATDAQIAKRKAQQAEKKKRQFIEMQLAEAGLKNASRRPMTKMWFPKSAADPIRAYNDYFRKVKAVWSTTTTISPQLKKLPPKEAAAIVLSGTALVRPDDEMWHSRKAAVIRSDYEKNDE